MKKHLSNFSLNAFPFFVGLLPSIFVIPIYLKTLGSEGLGIYYLYLAVVGIGGTFDFGIPQTIVKYVSEYRGVSTKFIQLTIYSSRLAISFANLLIVIIALLFCLLISQTQFLNSITLISVVLFTIGLILQMWFNFFISILKGFEKFKKIAIVETQNKLLFTGLGIVSAFYFKNVDYVIISHIFSLLVQNFVLLKTTVYFKNSYSYKLKFQFFKDKLWNYSKWILIQNTIGFLNSNIDKFIVVSFINLSSLAVYNTAKNVANLLPAFFGKGLSYLLPHVSKMKDKEHVRAFYVKYSYVFNAILAVIYIVGVLVSEPVLSFYLRGNTEMANQVVFVFRFLLISSVFMATSLLSFNLFNGIGEVKINTIIPFIGNVFSILLIIILGYYYGFWGVVFGRMNNVLISILVRSYTYNKIFKQKDYLIGLKMSMSILISILLIEIIYNY